MSDQSSQPSNHSAQDESAPQPVPETGQDAAQPAPETRQDAAQPAPEIPPEVAQRGGRSAEWQGSAAPADSGQRFAEAVDRKLDAAESADGTAQHGTSEDRTSEDAPASSPEEDESSIARPEPS
ncbi:MAG TPA: hypothetical protein VLI70_03675 [Micrococcaceae bacterium]|nr:hypothetical protein [Micrococcaceae bacterium]